MDITEAQCQKLRPRNPLEIGKFFPKMFDLRQESDYDDLVYFEEEKVKDWLEKAENYMKKLEKCIEKK